MSVDGGYMEVDQLHLASVSDRGQLDHLVQRAFDVWKFGRVLIEKISEETSHDRLMADDQDVLLPLQLHDDGFETSDDVLIRFSPGIPIMVLVLVSLRKVLGKFLLHLLVSHLVADSRVDLV